MVKISSQGCLTTLSDSGVVNVPAVAAYQILIQPEELLKWNTDFLFAAMAPHEVPRTGSVMKCSMKSTGKVTITFEDVIAAQTFTHHMKLKAIALFTLGEVRHKYEVADCAGKAKVTQTISYVPTRWGKIFKRAVVNRFRKMLPERFEDLQRYANDKHQL